MANNKSDDILESPEVYPPPPPAVTEAQKELAAQALHEFERKQYGACCNTMNKLMLQRGNDPKIIHNRVVAEFYQSGFQTTDELRQIIETVCKMAHVNIENVESLEDVDHSVIYYNQTAVLYNLRQYKAGLNILDKLFPYVEPLEESFARKILFLLTELYLCTFQPEKAMGMLTFMEKSFFTGKSPGERSDVKEAKEESNADIDTWKARMSLYKTRCLVMMKSMKGCKREIKSLMNIQGTNTNVIYLKSNFEYLRGNLKKAMKMLGSAPQAQLFTECGECLPVMYYNNLGCIHFHMRKHHLGAHYFRKALQENQSALKDVRRGSHQGQSVERSEDIAQLLSGRPLQMIGMSRHYELMYNMGIQQLHCGKPLVAFDCLIEAVQLYQINPRLWLRLGECCIVAHRENNDDDRKLEKRLEVIQGSVGSGIHRKLMLGPGVHQVGASPGTPAIPAAAIEFGSLCLRNALMLLPDDPLDNNTTQTEDQEEGKSPPESVLVPAPPGNPMKAAEVANLRCSILAASAYVCLCLNKYVPTIQYAENLLRQPRLCGAQKYLAHLYLAEALVSMDKIADAIQNLNPELVTDISTCPPELKSDQDKAEKGDKNDIPESTEAKGAFCQWTPRDLSRAKAIMQYNLAAAHAIRGENDKAMSNLGDSSKYIGTPLPAQMYFLKLYLDLIEGRRKMAQFVIKDHFGHVTPNRVEVKMEMKMNNKNNSNSWSETPVS